jgi:hypothetical protein
MCAVPQRSRTTLQFASSHGRCTFNRGRASDRYERRGKIERRWVLHRMEAHKSPIIERTSSLVGYERGEPIGEDEECD